MKQIYLAVLILFAIVTPASALDKDTNYRVMGALSCGEWVKERKEDGWETVVTISWVSGYLTAYNLLAPDTYNILGNTDRESVYLWIDNYCQANPLNDLSDAMVHLAIELQPGRTVTKP